MAKDPMLWIAGAVRVLQRKVKLLEIHVNDESSSKVEKHFASETKHVGRDDFKVKGIERFIENVLCDCKHVSMEAFDQLRPLLAESKAQLQAFEDTFTSRQLQLNALEGKVSELEFALTHNASRDKLKPIGENRDAEVATCPFKDYHQQQGHRLGSCDFRGFLASEDWCSVSQTSTRHHNLVMEWLFDNQSASTDYDEYSDEEVKDEYG